MKDLSFGIVFLEGVASFLSPCFLPLMPVYLGYLSGEAVSNRKWKVIKNSLGFILGFTFIFIILGAAASSIGHFLLVYRKLIDKILGVLVIIMGLFYMEIINIGFLNIERRFGFEGKKTGFSGAVLLGAAVSFGWTPCIGSILTSVLALAASRNSLLYGIYLLFAYSMGIAVPFLAAAVLIEEASTGIRKILRYTKVIKVVTGLILIATGIMIYTGYFGKLSGIIGR